MSREIEARLKLTAQDRTAAAFTAVAGRLRQVTGVAAQANAAAAMHARSIEATMAAMAMYVAPAAVTAGAVAAMKQFAEVERRMTRVRLTAGAAAGDQAKALAGVKGIANEVALPVDQVTAGLEDLVAQGRSLDEAMKFLPAVARTAQASGAAVSDIAATAGAIGDAFKISGDKMQGAFDILVEGGKAGKFELKDMSQYLPGLAPAAAAIGLQGEEGLKRLVAMLQIVRNQTGSSGEAATAMANVFQKMETEETANRFKKMGIDLRKEMTKARREGKDLTEVFFQLSEQALKGDLSKIPLLFADAQFATAMRAFLSQRQDLIRVQKSLDNSAGAVAKDLKEVIDDSQASFDRLTNSAGNATQALGKFIDQAGGSATLNELTDLLNRATGALDKLGNRDIGGAIKDVAGYLAGDPDDRGALGYVMDGADPMAVAQADAKAAAEREAKARADLARLEKIKERYGEAPLPAILAEQERAARAALDAESRAMGDAVTRTLPALPELSGVNTLTQAQAYQEYGRSRAGKGDVYPMPRARPGVDIVLPGPVATAAAEAAAPPVAPESVMDARMRENRARRDARTQAEDYRASNPALFGAADALARAEADLARAQANVKAGRPFARMNLPPAEAAAAKARRARDEAVTDALPALPELTGPGPNFGGHDLMPGRPLAAPAPAPIGAPLPTPEPSTRAPLPAPPRARALDAPASTPIAAPLPAIEPPRPMPAGVDFVRGQPLADFQAASDAARAAAGDIQSAFQEASAALPAEAATAAAGIESAYSGMAVASAISGAMAGGLGAMQGQHAAMEAEARRFAASLAAIYGSVKGPSVPRGGAAAGLNTGRDVAGNGMAGAP